MSEHSGDQSHGAQAPKQFHYFVDGVRYENTASTITGAQIKAQVANFNPAYALLLEGRGDQPDQVVRDTETISLGPPPPMLYTVPPATFG